MGRRERPIPPDKGLAALHGRRVLITGANGSLGTALTTALISAPVEGNLMVTDVDFKRGDPSFVDVTDPASVGRAFHFYQPDIIYHLAAAKHAPEGEEDPWETVAINVSGTYNVLQAAKAVGARVILASTCKACNPETVYGATKLTAERLVLNRGGWVARFFNVVESSGNVFRIWEDQIRRNQPLTVMPCQRYFMSLNEAIHLLLAVPGEKAGRYIHDPGNAREMSSVAKALYPNSRVVNLPSRRGDRKIEPHYARQETLYSSTTALTRVVSPHDTAR